MYKKSLWIILVTISVVLTANLWVTTKKVTYNAQKELHSQLFTLSYEANQISRVADKAINMVIERLRISSRDDMVSVFRSSTKDFSRLSVGLIFLVDDAADILFVTGAGSVVYNNKDKQKISAISTITKSDTNNVHLVGLERGKSFGAWTISIARAIINKKGDYMGSVIVNMPMSAFSNSIFKSHLDINAIEFYQDTSDSTMSYNIEDTLSANFILSIIFNDEFRANIPVRNLLPSINAILSIKAQTVKDMFWAEYIDHSLLGLGPVIILVICVIFIIAQFVQRIIDIRNKITQSSAKLHGLIPEYRVFDSLSGTDILTNIEDLTNLNSLVVETILKQNTLILEKNKQILILQRNCAASIGALQESSICLSENIDDFMVDNESLKQLNPDEFIRVLESIYLCSLDHAKHVASLKTAIILAQKISGHSRCYLDIGALIQTKFAGLYDSLTINRPNILNNSLFHVEAFENTVGHILLAIQNRGYIAISLTETALDGPITLEIFCRYKKPIDATTFQLAVEHARLFALIDEGIVGFYKDENIMVITIVYCDGNNQIKMIK